ncbi:MAG: hypothetical protein ACRENG_14440 [bacterium]
MTALTSYLANKAKLRHLSVGITAIILLGIYLLTQWLTYTMGASLPEQWDETMEVREVIKMEIRPVQKPVQKIERIVKEPVKKFVKSSPAPEAKGAAPDPGSIPQLADVSALMQGFDMKNMIAQASPATRTPVQRPNTRAVTVNSDITVQEAGLVSEGLLAAAFDVRPANQLAKRGSGGTPAQGSRVQIGNGRGEGGASGNGPAVGWGNDVGSGLDGIPESKGIGTRNTRGPDRGSDNSPRLLLGGLDKNGEGSGGSVSLLDLIEWMKKHPGLIPKLVAHEIGHQPEDLSSAVNFVMQGRSFTLYLSCNEHELLLRICLVEGNDYTMLKDNGIKENSNFLVAGDVIRQNRQIQSLISSRQAPGELANRFYRIFWSWWKSVRTKK